MDESIQAQLLRINREFYTRFADAFAETRTGAQPGWERIIPYLPPRCQVLDLGCGNGRLARFLDERLQDVVYTGIDGSPALVALAEQATARLAHVRTTFGAADLTTPGWERGLGPAQHDGVTALAVLHHIPGSAARSAFLIAAAGCLRGGGVLMLSNWRFLYNERMRRKIVPWETIGLSNDDVDPNDFLLDWRRDGAGRRYVHQLEPDEVSVLAAEAGFWLVEQYEADGREGNLSLYSVLRKPEGFGSVVGQG